MRTTHSDQQGLLACTTGKQAMAMLAQQARKHLAGPRRAGLEDGLVSSETVSELGKFRITVPCEYDVNHLTGVSGLGAQDVDNWRVA